MKTALKPKDAPKKEPPKKLGGREMLNGGTCSCVRQKSARECAREMSFQRFSMIGVCVWGAPTVTVLKCSFHRIEAETPGIEDHGFSEKQRVAEV